MTQGSTCGRLYVPSLNTRRTCDISVNDLRCNESVCSSKPSTSGASGGNPGSEGALVTLALCNEGQASPHRHVVP